MNLRISSLILFASSLAATFARAEIPLLCPNGTSGEIRELFRKRGQLPINAPLLPAVDIAQYEKLIRAIDADPAIHPHLDTFFSFGMKDLFQSLPIEQVQQFKSLHLELAEISEQLGKYVDLKKAKNLGGAQLAAARVYASVDRMLPTLQGRLRDTSNRLKATRNSLATAFEKLPPGSAKEAVGDAIQRTDVLLTKAVARFDAYAEFLPRAGEITKDLLKEPEAKWKILFGEVDPAWKNEAATWKPMANRPFEPSEVLLNFRYHRIPKHLKKEVPPDLYESVKSFGETLIRERKPKEIFVGVGTSPSAVVNYLKKVDGKLAYEFPLSTRVHAAGSFITEASIQANPALQAELKKLFEHFLPPPAELEGKTLVLLDWAQSGQGIRGSASALRWYLKQHSPSTKVAISVLTRTRVGSSVTNLTKISNELGIPFRAHEAHDYRVIGSAMANETLKGKASIHKFSPGELTGPKAKKIEDLVNPDSPFPSAFEAYTAQDQAHLKRMRRLLQKSEQSGDLP